MKGFIPSVLGPAIVVFGLIICALVVARERRPVVGFLLIFSLGPLIFTNLYFVHEYYWTAVLPAFLLVVGFAFESFSELNRSNQKLHRFRIASLRVLLTLSVTFGSWLSQGAENLSLFLRPLPLEAYGDVFLAVTMIEKYSNQDDKIVLVGFDWDSSVLYFANRKGIMIPGSLDSAILADSSDLGTVFQFVYFETGSDTQVDPNFMRTVLGKAPTEQVEGNLYRFIKTTP